MSSTDYRPALLDWWDSRCRAYLQENFGLIESQIREQLSTLLFPRAAEPTLPEQTLPIAFLHLRLLAGEELNIVLKRLEGLAALYGMGGAKPNVGTVYMCLTALTSTPGRLSSLVRAQTAFFSLLLRRVAGRLDRGVDEEEIRKELVSVWEIGEGGAVAASLESARGLWRRTQKANLGLSPLPFDLAEWFGRNALPAPAERVEALFPRARDYPHLFALAERVAAMDILYEQGAEKSAGERGAEKSAGEQIRAALSESISRGMEGLTPWEAEILRPVHLLLYQLEEWAKRLRLADGGETPTAHSGRERLSDWVTGYLQSARSGQSVRSDGEHVVAGRFFVGGWTYIAAGISAAAPGETASASLQPPILEALDRLSLRIRFGDGSEKVFPFDLREGKELLSAIFFAGQPDLRLDMFVLGEDTVWRFGASLYLAIDDEVRSLWRGLVLNHLERTFGGEVDRIKLFILQSIEKNDGQSIGEKE